MNDNYARLPSDTTEVQSPGKEGAVTDREWRGLSMGRNQGRQGGRCRKGKFGSCAATRRSFARRDSMLAEAA